MKRFEVITCFSHELLHMLSFGVTNEAFKKNLCELTTHDLRQYGVGNHHAIDDKPFGGGDGMVVTAPVLSSVFSKIDTGAKTLKVYLSPQGERLTQTYSKQILANYDHFVLLCGRYAGVDQRFLNHHQFVEISLGDFILSGGELAAACFIDVLVRQVPGVLGNHLSPQLDSFSQDPYLLEAPLFTRPAEWLGQSVPEVLLSGNHKLIETWRAHAALLITLIKRPDLFCRHPDFSSNIKKAENFFKSLNSAEKNLLGLQDFDPQIFSDLKP